MALVSGSKHLKPKQHPFISEDDKKLIILNGMEKTVKIILFKLSSYHTHHLVQESDKILLRAYGITQQIKIKLWRVNEANKFPPVESNPLKKSLISCSYVNCNFKCVLPSQLKSHTRVHSKVRCHKCRFCNSEYKTYYYLAQHLQNVHGEKKRIYPCPFPTCKYQCQSNQSRKNHLGIVHNQKLFECDSCKRCFKTKTGVISHMKRHSQVKPFKCNHKDCNFKCHAKNELERHELIHLSGGQRPLQCEFKSCTKTFSHSRQLTRHVLSMHTPKLNKHTLKCPLCEFKTEYTSNLKVHMGGHTKEKPFKCQLCAYSTKILHNLHSHIRSHTGEKPFACPICKKEFKEQSYLKLHMRTHTGERPFACHYCDYKTAIKSNLKSHIKRRHENEKRLRTVPCPFCSKHFYCNTNMKAHLTTHTKEKPHKCNLCNCRFRNSGNLSIHKRTHKGL